MTITDEKSAEYRELQISDRCDRCSAQAFTRAVKVIDDKLFELTFCGHHFKQLAYGLGYNEWKVQDNTNKIN